MKILEIIGLGSRAGRDFILPTGSGRRIDMRVLKRLSRPAVLERAFSNQFFYGAL
jgi:hypothetical protein